MARPLSDDELVAALAPLSLRSTLDPPALARAEGRSVTALNDVAALIDHFERALFAGPFSPATDLGSGRRQEVAASIAFQAATAQVVNPVLLAHRVLGIGLYPVIGDVRWRADGWVVRYGLAKLHRGDPAPTGVVLDWLDEQVTGFLADAVNQVVVLPPRLLLGNARAGIQTALVAAGEAAAGPLARDTCCLIHLAGMTPCDECPLADSSGRVLHRS